MPQRPLPDGNDQPDLLGEGDELAGRNQSKLGMTPANQRLETLQGASLQVQGRLVEQLKLPERHGSPQVQLKLPAGLHARVHLRLEEAPAPPFLTLGTVEREIGIPEEGVRILAVAR